MDSYHYENQNLLAIAGTSDSIILYDFRANKVDKKIEIPNGKSWPKYVTFTDSGELTLVKDSTSSNGIVPLATIKLIRCLKIPL